MTSLTHVQRVRMLYKMILRLHRGLPVEIQPLGNEYVREEFRRHKTCNATESHIFLNEWTVGILEFNMNNCEVIFLPRFMYFQWIYDSCNIISKFIKRI